MRRNLDNSFGADTGWRYPDGQPVRVGDRLMLKNPERPGTVRVRLNNGKEYFYCTYMDRMKVYSRGLPAIAETGFVRYLGEQDKTETENPDTGKLKWKMDPEGDFIFGIEDYDVAIYGRIAR